MFQDVYCIYIPDRADQEHTPYIDIPDSADQEHTIYIDILDRADQEHTPYIDIPDSTDQEHTSYIDIPDSADQKHFLNIDIPDRADQEHTVLLMQYTTQNMSPLFSLITFVSVIVALFSQCLKMAVPIRIHTQKIRVAAASGTGCTTVSAGVIWVICQSA